MTTATRTTAQGLRTRQLGSIHMAQKSLGLSQEDAQALKLGITGKASAADMSDGQRTAYLAHLDKLLAAQGLAAGKTPRPRKPMLSAPERKVWALWYELERVGRVNKPANPAARAAALRAYVKRIVGVDNLAFCTAAQQLVLIETMKKWIAREAQ